MLKKRKIRKAILLLLGFTILLAGFTAINYYKSSSHQQMIDLLKEQRKQNEIATNPFFPEAAKAQIDSMLREPGNENNVFLLESKAALALKVGHEDESIKTYESLVQKMN